MQLNKLKTVQQEKSDSSGQRFETEVMKPSEKEEQKVLDDTKRLSTPVDNQADMRNSLAAQIAFHRTNTKKPKKLASLTNDIESEDEDSESSGYGDD